MIEGTNACIFAFGSTGAGKTHSMLGPEGGRAFGKELFFPTFGWWVRVGCQTKAWPPWPMSAMNNHARTSKHIPQSRLTGSLKVKEFHSCLDFVFSSDVYLLLTQSPLQDARPPRTASCRAPPPSSSGALPGSRARQRQPSAPGGSLPMR